MGSGCSTSKEHTATTETGPIFVPPVEQNSWSEAEIEALANPTDWFQYHDRKFGFSFVFPSNWKLRKDYINSRKNHQITVRTERLHSPEHYFCTAEIAVIVDNFPSYSKTLKPPLTLRQLKQEMIKIQEGSVLLAEGVYISGVPAIRQTFSRKQADGTTTGVVNYTVMAAGGWLKYGINYFVSDLQYLKRYEKVAMQIINSVRIDFDRYPFNRQRTRIIPDPNGSQTGISNGMSREFEVGEPMQVVPGAKEAPEQPSPPTSKSIPAHQTTGEASYVSGMHAVPETVVIAGMANNAPVSFDDSVRQESAIVHHPICDT